MSSKNKVTAALLAIFLGGIGAHKFYLGQIKVGVVYLLFSWTGIPLLVGIIEGLMLLGMNDSDFATKYP